MQMMGGFLKLICLPKNCLFGVFGRLTKAKHSAAQLSVFFFNLRFTKRKEKAS